MAASCGRKFGGCQVVENVWSCSASAISSGPAGDLDDAGRAASARRPRRYLSGRSNTYSEGDILLGDERRCS